MGQWHRMNLGSSLVRAEGLEPPRGPPLEPKASVADNVTTPPHDLMAQAVAMGAVYSRGVFGMPVKKAPAIGRNQARLTALAWARVVSPIPAATTAIPVHTRGG